MSAGESVPHFVGAIQQISSITPPKYEGRTGLVTGQPRDTQGNSRLGPPIVVVKFFSLFFVQILHRNFSPLIRQGGHHLSLSPRCSQLVISCYLCKIFAIFASSLNPLVFQISFLLPRNVSMLSSLLCLRCCLGCCWCWPGSEQVATELAGSYSPRRAEHTTDHYGGEQRTRHTAPGPYSRVLQF